MENQAVNPDNRVTARSDTGSSKRRIALDAVTAVLLFTMCAMAAIIGVIGLSQLTSKAGTRDFVEYWAAGQMLAHGKSPYDATAIYQLERAAGWTDDHPEISFSPPTIFFLIAPLGLVSVKTGAILWLAFLFGCMIASLSLLWIVFGRPRGWLHVYCLCLAPVLTCFTAGQLGTVLLLGISLFMYLHNRHPFFAGIALIVCAFKPHLFLCFCIALLLWVVVRRQYRLVGGAAAGVAAACLITLFLDPQSFTQYREMMAAAQPTEHPFVPTLGKMLRLAVHPKSAWLQFVPAIAGCIWTAWFFVSRRRDWRWTHEGMLLLVVSMGCAPYSWFTDESLLVAPILAGLYRAQATKRSLLLFALINCVLLVELFKGYWITTAYFVWSVPAWLAWYLYASRESDQAQLENTAT